MRDIRTYYVRKTRQEDEDITNWEDRKTTQNLPDYTMKSNEVASPNPDPGAPDDNIMRGGGA